jgi:hypothetical protein
MIGTTGIAVETVRRAVERQLLTTLAAARVDPDPFSHIALGGVFPDELYDDLLANLPPIDHYYPDNPKKYGRAAARIGEQARPDGLDAPQSCRYLLPLSDDNVARLPEPAQALWGGVQRALMSDDVRRAIFNLFADDLCRRFRTPPDGLASLAAYPRPSLVRDLSGYWIEPHPDSPAKIVTVQFYLARDARQQALGTSLYRRHLFDPRNLLSLEHLFEKVRQMPFLPNSGYAFPVGRRSWHGREEVPEALGERHSLLLFYFRDPSRW